MNLTQVMSVLVHPGDSERKIVPQLHESAAWLVSLKPDLFRAIMNVDPEILLKSDIATSDPRDRAELVQTLLRLFDQEKLVDRVLDLYRHYKKLNHPELAKQLYPYICDPQKGIVVRRVAIDIAEVCHQKDLQDDLLGIALNPQESLNIRVEAVRALAEIADTRVRAKLRPLATNDCREDINDQLKGWALYAIWPSNISAEELFSALTPPKNDNFVGMYHRFLSDELIKNLRPSDLEEALKWVQNQNLRGHLAFAFKKLLESILIKAWDNLSSADLICKFAKAILSLKKGLHRL